jgi:hypothetical protein
MEKMNAHVSLGKELSELQHSKSLEVGELSQQLHQLHSSHQESQSSIILYSAKIQGLL